MSATQDAHTRCAIARHCAAPAHTTRPTTSHPAVQPAISRAVLCTARARVQTAPPPGYNHPRNAVSVGRALQAATTTRLAHGTWLELLIAFI
jgi:hypothetical protein